MMSDYVQVSVTKDGQIKPRLYRERWIMLLLFVISCASSVFHWIQYSIIANVIVDYYHVSYTAVDWTAMIYLLLYVPFVFPGCYLLDTVGLRKVTLLGMIMTSIGAWLKVATVSPERFWLVMIAQGIIGISQVCMLAIPPKLAGVWFGEKEVSTACSIGVFGMQLGIAAGFLLPSAMLDNQRDNINIEHGLYVMLIGMAVVNTLITIILIIFFKEKPSTPPSIAQLQVGKERQSVSFWQSIRSLLTHPSFVLLLFAHGINFGMFLAISQLLNQIVLAFYPDAAADAGRIGLLIIVTGTFGAISCGVVLDMFRRFKETFLTVYVLGLLSVIALTFLINAGISVLYVIFGFYGFFLTALFPLGLELGTELTYPTQESNSAGLLTAISQLFGIVFTYAYSYIFYNVGDKAANLCVCGVLAVGAILTIYIRFDLKRQAAQKQNRRPQIVKS